MHLGISIKECIAVKIWRFFSDGTPFFHAYVLFKLSLQMHFLTLIQKLKFPKFLH